jgi:hypothetical protein
VGGIGRLLAWLSGADCDILAAQHARVRAKYIGTGSGIAITGCIAGLSMWFALTTALGINAAIAAVLAVGWALVIMSIDRWLVVSLERRDGRGPLGYLVAASPRIALALVLGFVISTPITLRVFQKEIDFQLGLTQAAERTAYLKSAGRKATESLIAADRTSVASLSAGGADTSAAQPSSVTALESQQTAAKKQLASDQTSEANFYNQWQCEAYGIPLPDGATCPVGDHGPLATAAKKSYETYQTAVQNDQTTINGLQASINSANAGLKLAAQQQLPAAQAKLTHDLRQLSDQDADFAARNANDNGLLAQIDALDAASAASPGLQAARWLLFLVFLLIDCLPALMAITHVLNEPDDYEKAIGDGAATRKLVSETHLTDLGLDAQSLSAERAKRRDATARVRAEAEQHVAMHKARRWADTETRLGGRRAGRRSSRRSPASSARTWPRATAPAGSGTPQVFIRRYTPPPNPADQNGHAQANGWSGAAP